MSASEGEPIDGYEVVSLDGNRIGTVAGVSTGSIVVEQERWLRASFRALPRTLAAVRQSDRSVIVLVPPEVLARSPKIRPDQPVDEELVAAHYEGWAVAEAALALDDQHSRRRDA